MLLTETFKVMIVRTLAPHFHVKLGLSGTCDMKSCKTVLLSALNASSVSLLAN